MEEISGFNSIDRLSPDQIVSLVDSEKNNFKENYKREKELKIKFQDEYNYIVSIQSPTHDSQVAKSIIEHVASGFR